MIRYSVLPIPVSQELYALTNTVETTTLHALTFNISFKWNILREEKDLYLLTNPIDWSNSHINWSECKYLAFSQNACFEWHISRKRKIYLLRNLIQYRSPTFIQTDLTANISFSTNSLFKIVTRNILQISYIYIHYFFYTLFQNISSKYTAKGGCNVTSYSQWPGKIYNF